MLKNKAGANVSGFLRFESIGRPILRLARIGTSVRALSTMPEIRDDFREWMGRCELEGFKAPQPLRISLVIVFGVY